MIDIDDKLSKVLKSWHNVEPSSVFESNVWQHIRQQTVSPQNTLSLRHFLTEWTNIRPTYVTIAAAAFVGIVTGLTSTLTIPFHSQNLHNNLFRPLPERSLSA